MKRLYWLIQHSARAAQRSPNTVKRPGFTPEMASFSNEFDDPLRGPVAKCSQTSCWIEDVVVKKVSAQLREACFRSVEMEDPAENKTGARCC
ncbi:YnfC family lipoprotein [Pseudomonas aeruginosa]|uniref:YnfC family lipoprotein n=1 Tax=Pseudomonas aeruginosa TaxID=287 RepID=UPI003F5BCA16